MRRARATGAITATLAMVAFAANSHAAERAPAKGYGQFAGCPSHKEVASTEICFRSVISGGRVRIGSREVPIEHAITISGGISESGDVVANAKSGLTPVKEMVPAGVVGLTGMTWLSEVFAPRALSLYAVTELAGIPGNPLAEPVKLPIKVHLMNGLLSAGCYVGTNSDPIKLKLITGTTNPPSPNKPISGNSGKPTYKTIQTAKGAVLVDNSFATPGATGCTLETFGFISMGIDDLIDSQSNLPAPAGTNEAVQKLDAEIVASSYVYPPSG